MKTHTVKITGYNSSGEGVARLDDGRVVFLRSAVRDDILEVEIIKKQRRVAWAKIIKIASPSPYRIDSDCSVYPECGGCDYRHITYEEELFAKLQCVNDALLRIGKFTNKIDQIINTGQINGYRNKAVLHSDGESLGFYKAQSHDVIPVNKCLLLKDDLNTALQNIKKPVRKPGEITIRSGRNGTTGPLEEDLDGLIFKLNGFFQVNTEATKLLFRKAREYAALTKNETLMDLYCGVGAMTLFIGRDAGHAIGIEHNSNAVNTARDNALKNHLSHIKFIHADVDELTCDITDPDCVIVDPPRKGLSKKAINKILNISPKRLIYISCNPATMARDLNEMQGYVIKDISAVDMFPRTANVECCCLLVKE